LAIALVTFVAGIVLIAAAKPISGLYLLGFWGGRPVPTYAILQAGGHIVGLAIFVALTPQDYRDLYLRLICLVLFPAAAISARVICGMTDYWPRFRQAPIGFILHADRYSAFGGLTGALAAYAIAVAVFHVPFGAWVIDAFCFGLLGAEIVSRLGCHANGCCYGKPVLTEARIARWFSVVYRDELQKAVWHGGLGGRSIYAAPLCIGVLNLILICLLLVIASLCKPPAGLLGGIGLMLYPYCRLVNDFLRVDRNGMGKTFTYLFLPVLFACGFIAFATSFQSPAPPRTLPDFAALGDPKVYVFLVVEYILLVAAYGWGVEFKQSDRVAGRPELGDALVAAEAPLVQPD